MDFAISLRSAQNDQEKARMSIKNMCLLIGREFAVYLAGWQRMRVVLLS